MIKVLLNVGGYAVTEIQLCILHDERVCKCLSRVDQVSKKGVIWESLNRGSSPTDVLGLGSFVISSSYHIEGWFIHSISIPFLSRTVFFLLFSFLVCYAIRLVKAIKPPRSLSVEWCSVSSSVVD